MTDEINVGHQGGIAVCTVFLLDWLKRAKWFPWINENTERLNRGISLLAALSTAAGLSIVSAGGDLHSGGQLTISYPPLTVMFDLLMHSAVQFGAQETLHKLLGNHVMDKIILDELSHLREDLKPKA